MYEAGIPAGEYGTTVELLGLRSLSREWNIWSLSEDVYGLGPTGYLDALETLYFDEVTPFVTYNSPVTVIDTSGIKPVAIDDKGVSYFGPPGLLVPPPTRTAVMTSLFERSGSGVPESTSAVLMTTPRFPR